MIRLLRMLVLALLLAPSLGQSLHQFQEAWAVQQADCCDPDRGCDDDCVDCGCGPVRAVADPVPAVALTLESPPAAAASAPALTPPAEPLSDILHVPKSA